MSSFQIVVGSMLGGSEYVSEACQETLEELDHQVDLHLSPVFSEIPRENQTWLICTSTHGAGEYPDNIQAFISDLENCSNDLSTVNFFVIALGDSNYDTFCQAGKNIEKLLISKGCNKLIDIKTVDMAQDLDPEEYARSWLLENSELL